MILKIEVLPPERLMNPFDEKINIGQRVQEEEYDSALESHFSGALHPNSRNHVRGTRDNLTGL